MSSKDIAALSCPPDTSLPVMFDWDSVASIPESEPIQITPVDPREQFIQDVERFYGALFAEVSRRKRQTCAIQEAFSDVMAAGDKSQTAIRMCFTEVIKDSELALAICQILVSDHGRNRLRLDRRCDVSVQDIRQFYEVVLDAETDSSQALGPSFKREQRAAERRRRRAIVVPRLDVRAAANFLIREFSGEAAQTIAMQKAASDLVKELGLRDRGSQFQCANGRVQLQFSLYLESMDKSRLAPGSQEAIIAVFGALVEVMKDQGIEVPLSLHDSLRRVWSIHGPQIMTRYEFGPHGYLRTFKTHATVVMTAAFANRLREFLANYYVGK